MTPPMLAPCNQGLGQTCPCHADEKRSCGIVFAYCGDILDFVLLEMDLCQSNMSGGIMVIIVCCQMKKTQLCFKPGTSSQHGRLPDPGLPKSHKKSRNFGFLKNAAFAINSPKSRHFVEEVKNTEISLSFQWESLCGKCRPAERRHGVSTVDSAAGGCSRGCTAAGVGRAAVGGVVG